MNIYSKDWICVCKMTDCLMIERRYGVLCCSAIVPTIRKELTPNSSSCKYYSNDFERELEALRRDGGLYYRILGTTKEKELKKLKKAKEICKKKTKK